MFESSSTTSPLLNTNVATNYYKNMKPLPRTPMETFPIGTVPTPWQPPTGGNDNVMIPMDYYRTNSPHSVQDHDRLSPVPRPSKSTASTSTSRPYLPRQGSFTFQNTAPPFGEILGRQRSSSSGSVQPVPTISSPVNMVPCPSQSPRLGVEGGIGWSESHRGRRQTYVTSPQDSTKTDAPNPVPSLPPTLPQLQKPFDPAGSPVIDDYYRQDDPGLTRSPSIEFQSPNTPDDCAPEHAVSSVLLQKLGLHSPTIISPVTSIRSHPAMPDIKDKIEISTSTCMRANSCPHPPFPVASTSIPIALAGANRSPTPWTSLSSSLALQELVGKSDLAPSQSVAAKSRLNLASFSLTHDKQSLKTYRRMANKTRDKGVQMNYAHYLLEVAELYVDNKPTRKRLMQEASYWLDRLARAGVSEALLIKGRWHLTEDHEVYGKPNLNRALRCFLDASKSGSMDAYYELGQLWKQRKKYSKAVANYRAAAAQGHCIATYTMAKILLRGQMEQIRQIGSGMDYLRRAADMDGPCSAEAAFALSCVYANDLDCIGLSGTSMQSYKDPRLAIEYLHRAADLGYTHAIYRLGRIHEDGLLGQPKDAWQAFQYYQKGCQENYAPAMLALALLYQKGIAGRVPVQIHEAFRWCQAAADKGFDMAEYTLGTFYEDGIGTLPDYSRALQYFGKAVSKGNALAAAKLNQPIPSRPLPTLSDEDEDFSQGDSDYRRVPCYIM